MILLISRVGHTVNKIMDWLTYHNQPFIRFSDLGQLFELLSIEISDDHLSIRIKKDDTDIDLSEINVVWVWHGDIRFRDLSMKEISRISSNQEVSGNLQTQMKAIYGFIEHYLNTKLILGHTYLQDVNKLLLLSYAKEAGIHIPQSYIYSAPADLLRLLAQKELITKSLQYSPVIHDAEGQTLIRGYTMEVFPEQLKGIDRKEIFPSFVQEKLDKKYEIRIFYLDGKCYPMAIFSQRDKQTAIDFRRYNDEKPNRMMKCSIPQDLEDRIAFLMNKAGLNTGSLDFVKTKDNKYVFLEVNPVGQFGFVSHACNYQLEKMIAEKLISYC